jgi:glycosyltransferase involved in cell wall biosynthesis
MKIAIVGTQGVPNHYGGFETLATFLAEHLSDQIDMTIYCSSTDQPHRPGQFCNASLRYIPFSSHGFAGMLYDMISLYEAVKKNDVVLLLGLGAGYLLPFLSKKQRQKIILNFGGLDWKRDKWALPAKKVIHISEGLLVKYIPHIVADNRAIQHYIESTYHKKSAMIAYGGDQAFPVALTEKDIEQYPFLQHPYAFSVCRIQSDNQIDLLLASFAQTSMPFVLVGNWSSSSFGRKIREKYQSIPHLHLLDAIYEPTALNKLRSNCKIYMHGHTAGGTNPSLVEAMYLGLPIAAYSSAYNVSVTLEKAVYFKDLSSLVDLINNIDKLDLKAIGNEMKTIALADYTWSKIIDRYYQLFLSVGKAPEFSKKEMGKYEILQTKEL